MKSLILLILAIPMICPLSFAQDAKDVATKMEQFSSKTGTILKFIDYKLPDIKLNVGIAECRVRKITSAGETKCFLQISKEGQYDTKTASIAYEDLLEIIKALQTLKQETSSDAEINPDYLENKFITEDGFQLGYFINNGNIRWYLVLEKYGSGNTVFVRDVSVIENLFTSAKDKIEGLR